MCTETSPRWFKIIIAKRTRVLRMTAQSLPTAIRTLAWFEVELTCQKVMEFGLRYGLECDLTIARRVLGSESCETIEVDLESYAELFAI